MRVLSRLLVVLATLMALFGATSAPANAANDYPWRTDSTQSADRWGFTKRQCVSFVAWRLAQRGTRLDNRTQRWGNATNWDNAARRMGHRVGTRPVVGAIAQWNAYEGSAFYTWGSTRPNARMRAGGYGHVAYVEAVYRDGSVRIAQYNMYGNRSYSLVRAKAPRYLYVKVRAPR